MATRPAGTTDEATGYKLVNFPERNEMADKVFRARLEIFEGSVSEIALSRGNTMAILSVEIQDKDADRLVNRITVIMEDTAEAIAADNKPAELAEEKE